jgi:uncharacterized membrane protein
MDQPQASAAAPVGAPQRPGSVTTAGIFLMVLGAILAFAVTEEVAGIDIQVVGYILLVVGVIGLVLGLVLMRRGRPPDVY